MALSIGIVGLPNVGKSTLFNALTKAQNAQAANYPFCTIEPNKATVAVPDKRVDAIHASVDFIDIAGLVRGASKGEGLGNQFLANIRECAAIVEVVRCFEDENITHVDGGVDPLRDIDTIETELLLADIQSVEKRLEKLEKYFHREDTSAFVTFNVEKDKLCTAEITIRDGSTILRAQTTEPDGDMRGAIDAAVSYIERQILKNKTRLSKRLRTEGLPAEPADDFSVAEEAEFRIVRTKRFSVKPMSPEEAILQMNLLDHDFYVFRNSDDDSISIVYHRKKGGYGLIVTDDEE